MRSVPGAISRTSKRTFEVDATCPSTDGTGASPPVSPLKRPLEAPKPRAQLALFTFTVPVTIGDEAGPCSASSASTVDRIPSGYRRIMSWPTAVTSNSLN